VALEATGPANAIARILEPHVGRVVIANTRRVRAIAEAKVKSDKVDAATLCELLDAGFLPAVWSPDEQTRVLRGLLGRRDRQVRSRTRAKNAVHAALGRELKGRPPMSDLFGREGRAWLGRLELPAHERQIVASCLREVDFLSREIAALEAELAKLALSSEQVKRLMTVPGVSLISAATFVAVVGEIGRFETPKKLVRYVGLDPKVRQSGETKARHAGISKQGSAAARHMLCEAAWIAVRTPGPLRAFYERVRARRGAQIALVATARKLCVLVWQLLTHEQDYALALQGHFGIGELTSVAILAELGDARRFSSSRHAVRFAGLDVTVSQPDQSRAPGKLSHQGPPVLRWAAFEAAQCARRERSPDHGYYLDTRGRLDGKQATPTIARKLIRRAHHTLRELGDEALEPVPAVT
jgi:transposase